MKALSLWSVILTLLLFSGSVYAGFQFAHGEAALALGENLRGSLSPLRQLGSLSLLFVIFLNNSIKALLVIVLGIVPFVFSAGFILLNGFILGMVVNQTVAARGPGFTLLGILPHGLLELTAILISVALGFQISLAFLASLSGKKGQLKQQYKASLFLYLKFVVPALFVAATIETVVGKYLLPRG